MTRPKGIAALGPHPLNPLAFLTPLALYPVLVPAFPFSPLRTVGPSPPKRSDSPFFHFSFNSIVLNFTGWFAAHAACSAERVPIGEVPEWSNGAAC